MSNIKLIIEERAANIGNFMVGLLLPFRQKKWYGPFIYIDHMGPVKMNEWENIDVQTHPYIGISTQTKHSIKLKAMKLNIFFIQKLKEIEKSSRIKINFKAL